MADTWTLEITDPTDPATVHTFTGATEEEVDAEADRALGVDVAEEPAQP